MKDGRMNLLFGIERAYGGTAECGECDDRCGRAAEGEARRKRRVQER